MDWMLTDEELWDVMKECNDNGSSGLHPKDWLEREHRAIARAAAKKLLEPSAGSWTDCPPWEHVMCDRFKLQNNVSPCADCWAAWELVTNWQSIRAAVEGK